MVHGLVKGIKGFLGYNITIENHSTEWDSGYTQIRFYIKTKYVKSIRFLGFKFLRFYKYYDFNIERTPTTPPQGIITINELNKYLNDNRVINRERMSREEDYDSM